MSIQIQEFLNNKNVYDHEKDNGNLKDGCWYIISKGLIVLECQDEDDVWAHLKTMDDRDYYITRCGSENPKMVEDTLPHFNICNN